MKPADLQGDIALKFGLVLAVLASLVGCGGSSSGGGGTGVNPPPPAAAKSIYVIQAPVSFGMSSGSILQFSTATSGSVSPESTITAPTDNAFQALATDSDGNIYTSGNTPTTSTLLEYAAGASGSATPTRSIPSNDTTRMWNPDGLAISPSGQIILGEDNGGIATYSATADGNVAPEYYILGNAQTGGGLSPVNAAQDVALGANGNLYVFNWQFTFPFGPPIEIFSSTATGNVAPIGFIGGSNSGMDGDSVNAIATDSSGNLYVANNGAGGPSIVVFAPTATGNVAPMRTITGASTQLSPFVGGIQVDAVGNIYVITFGASGSNPAVLKFAATATGNVAPVLRITSPAWTYPDNYFSLAVY